MPTDITTYIHLESQAAGMAGGRQVDHSIRLDEGFDRPYWEWVQNKPVRAFLGSVWVPEKPETLLLDGLLMLAAEGLNQPEILAAADAIRRDKGSNTTIVDIAQHPLDSALKQLLASALANYTVNIVCLPGSGVLRQIHELDSLGINYRLLEEAEVD